MDIGSLVTGIAFTVAYILFVLLFLYKERKSGRRVYFLKESFMIGILTGIISIMLAGPEFDIFSLGRPLLDRIGLGLGVFVFLLIWLFFVSMWSESPDWRIASVIVGLGVSSIIAGSLSVESTTPVGDIGILIWRGAYDAFSFIVFSFGAWIYIHAYRRLPEWRSLIISIALFAVCISYLLTFLLYDLSNYSGFQIQMMLGIDTGPLLDTLRAVFLLVIVFTLLSDMEYFYRIPLTIYSLYIISMKTGLCLYHYTSRFARSDPNLFASALTAISLVMEQSSDISTRIHRVQTGRVSIIVENHHTGEVELMFAALLDRVSMVVTRSLQVFANAFMERYGSQIDVSDINAEYTETDLLLHMAFPFLKVSTDTSS